MNSAEGREQSPKSDMIRDEISVRLTKRRDTDGTLFLIGTPDIPATINLRDCFLIVFTGDRPCLVIRKKAPSKREGQEVPLEGGKGES